MITKLKLFLILFFLIVSNKNSIAQKSSNKSREIEEIKLIFNDFDKKENNLPFYIQKDGNLILPAKFQSCKNFYLRFLTNKQWQPFFVHDNIYVYLKKSDCVKLNLTISKDTNSLNVSTHWFDNNRITVLTDSITKYSSNIGGEFMKPIFFSNYSRCFIAIYYKAGLETFFLKKKNNHWMLDKFYLTTAED